MGFRQKLFSYLDDGHLGATCYSSPLPATAHTPYVLALMISSTPNQDNLGATDTFDRVWQFDIYADTFAEIEPIRDRIWQRLNRPGEWFFMSGLRVWNCRVESEMETTELEMQFSETKLSRYTIQARIITE